MVTCDLCGTENADTLRDCRACGAPLPVPASVSEKRKTVTIVFCDVAASTTLGEQLDPESLRRVMSRYFREMKAALDRHGGTVEKFIGDAVMAVFGIPVLHEDDALRAVRAANDMRTALATLNDELERDWGVRIRARTGVNTGEVVAGDATTGQTFVTGDAVNVAARLEQAAAPGEIFLGAATYRLVRDAVAVDVLEPLPLKGKSEPVPAFRLVAVSSRTEGVARRQDGAFVGRNAELAQLTEIADRVRNERSCQLVTIVAPPGTGKSRLRGEFIDRLGDDVTVVSGHCLSYGEGMTYWPIAEIIHERCGILDDDDATTARLKLRGLLGSHEELDLVEERLAKAVGLIEGIAQTEETFWAVRKLFEGLAAERPLIVVFEDIHWAEPTFLDLLDYLIGWSRGEPILLLCSARPDVGELRPTWLAPRPGATTLQLTPLVADDSRRLVQSLLGEAEIDQSIVDRIVAAAEGTPLFVEEVVRILIDDGQLRRDNGRWIATANFDELRIPPTVEALLGSRLDRLPGGERDTLARSATIGRVFWWSAAAELAAPEARASVGNHLQALVRRDLILPEASTMKGEDAFRFGHVLIREVAYRSLGKELRSSLHQAFAAWLERKAGDRQAEYDEIIGFHLEQAFRHREQLGPLDDAARVLRIQAGMRLGAAGRRAAARGDAPAATALLTRAADLLPDGSRARLELLPILGNVLVSAGELGRAIELLTEAADGATALPDPGLAAHARIERAFVRLVTDPVAQGAEVDALVEDSLATFRAVGDELGVSRAWRLRSWASWATSHYGRAAEMLDQALHHARQAGNLREEGEIVSILGGCLCYGPTPVREALERIRTMNEDARLAGAARVEAATLAMLAYLEALDGRIDEARLLLARDHAILEELGLGYTIAKRGEVRGLVEMLAGDPAAAEREVRTGIEALEGMGEVLQYSTMAADLAQTLIAQGRDDEAEPFVRTSEATATEDDLTSQVLWRSARATLRAHRGDAAGAEGDIDEAVVLALESDDLRLHGATMTRRAQIRAQLGRHQDAAADLREAIARYERKECRLDAELAREALGELQGTAGPAG